MRRMVMLIIVIGLVLVGCSQDETNDNNEKNTLLFSAIINSDSATKTVITSSTEQKIAQVSSGYVAKNEIELSSEDFDTAYEMCVQALTNYYYAVWNGSAIDLHTFFDNNNLKKYTEKKIQSQYEQFGNLNSKVKNIEIDAWEVEYTDDAYGGYLYLNIPVNIKKFTGGYGEGAEFLVRNVKGKLVIVDWYTGGKDSYDFMVRGENLTIDNPNIWNDSEWVKKLNSKQNDFLGGSR
ncbi:hypothetical protein [Sporosarcina sp. D27]|uniref:hypothetical protein n=1 Tax=Sporosarcina sp. D27 TaxID=1382305 RepID=UPI0004726A65|nr:hypothetical protein [Sporosarcina sp. D27]